MSKASDLHKAIMELPCPYRYLASALDNFDCYRVGHKDATIAAASLAQSALAAMEEENKRLLVTIQSLRVLAQTWRMENGDYPEAKDDCAADLLDVIDPKP